MLNQATLDHIKRNFDLHASILPAHMIGAMERYLMNGIPPGDFLTAVLANDLMEAIGRADSTNRYALPVYAEFIYNHIPSTAHGSYEAVRDWINSFHLEETNGPTT